MVCRSVDLSAFRPSAVGLSVFLPVCLSVWMPAAYLLAHLAMCAYLQVWSVGRSRRLAVCRTVCRSVDRSVFLPVGRSIWLSASLSASLPACRSVRLAGCPFRVLQTHKTLPNHMTILLTTTVLTSLTPTDLDRSIRDRRGSNWAKLFPTAFPTGPWRDRQEVVADRRRRPNEKS